MVVISEKEAGSSELGGSNNLEVRSFWLFGIYLYFVYSLLLMINSQYYLLFIYLFYFYKKKGTHYRLSSGQDSLMTDFSDHTDVFE